MSATTINLDEKTYGQLLGRTLPHVIHTDEECERLTNELLRLDERENPWPEEKELAELLTTLIDEYEERSNSENKSTADTPALDGGAQPDSKRPLENIRLERNYFRGISREALHQQNAGKKAGWVFPCQRRAVHLENPSASLLYTYDP